VHGNNIKRQSLTLPRGTNPGSRQDQHWKDTSRPEGIKPGTLPKKAVAIDTVFIMLRMKCLLRKGNTCVHYFLIPAILVLGSPRAQEGSYSYYCSFSHEPTIDGYYGDSLVINGPFRANGPIWLLSMTPGRDNDPWFQSLTLSSDHYLCGYGKLPAVEPQCGDLWIEPYEFMVQGPPWFTLGADPLPFGPDQVDWQALRTTAMNHGLFLSESQVPTNSRLLLQDGLLSVKASAGSDPVHYSLSGLEEPVVWIESNPEHRFYLKGHPDSPGFSGTLTIGTLGHVLPSGPLLYNHAQPGMLGIVSAYGDCSIASTLSPYWSPPYNVDTQYDLTFSASFLLLDGVVEAENFYNPSPQADFTILGGIQMVTEGYTGTSTRGYNLVLDYDQRLAVQSPPHYPQYALQGTETEHTAPVPSCLTAYPNPFTAVVTIDSEPGRLTVFDASGRTVQSTDTDGLFVFDGSNRPAGIYVITVSDDTGRRTSLLLIKL